MNRFLVRAMLCCMAFTCGLVAVPVEPKGAGPSDPVFALKQNGPARGSEPADPNAKRPIFLFDDDDDSEADEKDNAVVLKDKKHGHGGHNHGHHGNPGRHDDAVPEPGTYALLGAGMIGLALLRKRKGRRPLV